MSIFNNKKEVLKKAVNKIYEHIKELNEEIQELTKLANQESIIDVSKESICERIENAEKNLDETKAQLECITYLICLGAKKILKAEQNSNNSEVKNRESNPLFNRKKENRLSQRKLSGSLYKKYGDITGFVDAKLKEYNEKNLKNTQRYKSIYDWMEREIFCEHDDTNKGEVEEKEAFKKGIEEILKLEEKEIE